MRNKIIATILAAISATCIGCYAKKETEKNSELPAVSIVYEDNSYCLSFDEFNAVCRAVMSEAGGEGMEGMMAVAQCCRNACKLTGERPTTILKEYQYAGWYNGQPSKECEEAVYRVFTLGESVFGNDVTLFYAPARCKSAWHEKQRFAKEIGGHRFFAEA